MVTAIILSGGISSRMGGDVPKQYVMVNDKPLIMYCFERISQVHEVDGILIVAAESWQSEIRKWINDSKFIGFADAGATRQHSVYNGLKVLNEKGIKDEDTVLIHDAARPCVSEELLRKCIKALEHSEGVMPVLPIKDTIYLSRDGRFADGLLNRDELCAGQAPEGFRFGKYFAAHKEMTDEMIARVRGSSEIAVLGGIRVCLVNGDESNFKITTKDDLERFRKQFEQGVLT